MRSEGYCSRPVCVCVCVCVCFQGLHLRLVQLSDKLGILVISVSCSLVFKFGMHIRKNTQVLHSAMHVLLLLSSPVATSIGGSQVVEINGG